MPFGLTNAPTVFQALVNDVLQYVPNHFVFVYLHVFRLHGLFVEVVPDQSVLFSLLERVLQPDGSHGQSLLWVPPSVQWTLWTLDGAQLLLLV